MDGTLEADAVTIDGVALGTFIRDTVGTNMLSSNTESGITVTYDTSNDNIDFSINASQTGITSLLATDIVIGEDAETKIDFETANEIHFDTNNAERLVIDDSDAITIGQGMNLGTLHADVNLGTSATEVFDLTNTAPSDNTGDGTYLFNAVRRGGSYSTRFTGIIGVDNGGIAVVDTIENNGFTISVAGMVIKAVDSGCAAINISATLQPLAIGD